MHREYSRRQCLICHQDLYLKRDFFHLCHNPPICMYCCRQLIVRNFYFMIKGYQGIVVYSYNDFFAKLLFQYKGLYDEALYSIFLFMYISKIKSKYKDYIVVVLPSSYDDNHKRGFIPNVKIFEHTNLELFTGLYKKNNYKQTNQKNRERVREVIKLKDGHKLTHKKVLLFDDVITSGNTLYAAITLIEQYRPSKIEIMVLSSKQNKTKYF